MDSGIDVEPDVLLGDALDIMARAGTAFLIVVKSGNLVGLLSEDDVVKHVSQHGGLHETPVSQVMRSDVEWVRALSLQRANKDKPLET